MERRVIPYSDGAAALYEFCLDARTGQAIETQFAGQSTGCPGRWRNSASATS